MNTLLFRGDYRATPEDTQSYASTPTVQVISNTAVLQALASTNGQYWAGNFFQAGSAEDVQALTAGACLQQRLSDRLQFSFADPTRSLAMIQFNISNITAATVIKKDDQVTVNFDMAQQLLSVSVDTSIKDGRSYQLVLAIA